MPIFTTTTKLQNKVDEADIDLSAQMRLGHPQVPETDAAILETIKRYAQQVDRPIRVFQVHCRTAVFAAKLIEAMPEIQMVAHENYGELLGMMQNRLADTTVTAYTGKLREWNEPADIIISMGIHHHVSRNYLDQVKRLLRPEGIFILSDEFCPEYCTGKYAERIRNADSIYLAGGYVMTNAQEIEAYEKAGEISQMAQEIEYLRKHALWKWYRYVIDYAMEQDNLHVAVDELRGAQEDLITDSEKEHKLSPLIVERELELHGFEQRSKKSMAPNNPLELQSFFVYEFVPKA